MLVVQNSVHQRYPEVLISSTEKSLRIGKFYDVCITDSDEFDLFGEVVK